MELASIILIWLKMTHWYINRAQWHLDVRDAGLKKVLLILSKISVLYKNKNGSENNHVNKKLGCELCYQVDLSSNDAKKADV